jgi:hypothetical protein
MKYALLLYADPAAPEQAGVEPAPMQEWIDYTKATAGAGILAAAEQLEPADTATTLRVRDGERLLTDGPFAETKEHLLGFYLIDVPDLDTALAWAERVPFVRYATVELRPVVEAPGAQEMRAG